MVQALVAAVVLMNLVLTIGAIHRLRQHAEALSRLTGSGRPTALPPVGQRIPEFATTAVDGQPIGPAALSGETLVGFFSARCPLCRLRLPSFVALARSAPGGRDRVLAVATGAADEVADLVAELRPVARVATEGYGGPLATAFQVKRYPTVVTVAPDPAGHLVVVAHQDLAGVAASAVEELT